MGAWGQPMAMSFSQAHHTVLYGSETNCSMIPIATRPGVSPAGGRVDEAALVKAAGEARGARAADRGTLLPAPELPSDRRTANGATHGATPHRRIQVG